MIPNRKIGAGTSVGVLTAVIGTWALGEFAAIFPPPEVVAAAGALLTGIAGYIIPER
jgi:hypothetical protein